ncbi:MAG TPA: ABC transporter ATP-binding protein, partial [Anaerolineae bacterium]
MSTYLRPQWRRVLLLAAIVAGATGLSLVNPQILRYFIDAAASHAPLQSLVMSGVLYTIIAIVGQLAIV